jgi:hypothetical protein
MPSKSICIVYLFCILFLLYNPTIARSLRLVKLGAWGFEPIALAVF